MNFKGSTIHNKWHNISDTKYLKTTAKYLTLMLCKHKNLFHMRKAFLKYMTENEKINSNKTNIRLKNIYSDIYMKIIFIEE